MKEMSPEDSLQSLEVVAAGLHQETSLLSAYTSALTVRLNIGFDAHGQPEEGENHC